MIVLVIDAHGGGVGKQLVTSLRSAFPDMEIMAVGTNSTATSVMLKAGATHAATGENAVVVACRKADVIVGPLGIVIADAMYGEITPAMAIAVAQSSATRILIPFNQCDNIIVGIADYEIKKLVQGAIDEVRKVAAGNVSPCVSH
ncbi:MAG: DUF3842 family protein [Victivallales bacterium]|nr:DUF3842 family protein [Victivallales bacterium]